MYLELTPADTVKDLQNLIVDAIPGFEFPRVDLYDYTIEVKEIPESEMVPDDFVLGTVWGEIGDEEHPDVLVDRSYFNADLTNEEMGTKKTAFFDIFLIYSVNSEDARDQDNQCRL